MIVAIKLTDEGEWNLSVRKSRNKLGNQKRNTNEDMRGKDVDPHIFH